MADTAGKGGGDKDWKRRSDTRRDLLEAAAKEKNPRLREHLIISATHGRTPRRLEKNQRMRGAY